MKHLYTISLFLCCVTSGFSQTAAEKFTSWSAANPAIQPYLFFNQPKYAPGDTAYFKAYVVQDDTLLKRAVILNVAVVDQHARRVAGVNIRVEKGEAHNQLVLPDSLKPGIYRFVAFNERTISHPASSAFQSEFRVVNNQAIQHITSANDLRFYPEGGVLVNGITNKVIVSGEISENVDCELLDTSGSVITTFPMRSGYGFFHIKPEEGKNYSVRVNGTLIAVPQGQNDGIAILFTPGAPAAPARIVLAAPSQSAFRSVDLDLVLTINGNVYLSNELQFGDKEFIQIGIPKASLPIGVATLSVLSGGTRLLAERKFYVGNPEQVKASLTPVKETVLPRGKVEVEVSLSDELGNPMEGRFAVSAINQRLFARDGDLRPVRNTIFAGEEINEVKDAATLDLSLAALRPNDQLWKAVLGPGDVEYPTTTFMHFRGRAFIKGTNEAVPDSTRVFVYFQKDALAYACVVMNGAFDLYPFHDFRGVDELYYEITLQGKPLKDAVISWINPAPDLVPSSASKLAGVPDPYAAFTAQARLISHSYAFYSQDDKLEDIVVGNPNALLEQEAGGADVTIKLEDYIAFPNMDEVIREIIPMLSHRKQGGRSIVRVSLTNTDQVSKADPLYVIDGLITRNTEYFMNLVPSNVISVKVVRDFEKLNMMGRFSHNGVVFVQTKKPNPERVRAASSFVSLMGTSRPLRFRTIDHSNDTTSLTPDFRSTVYWNPSIRTDRKGKAIITFYVSDDIGPIKINIAGTTARGQRFSGSTSVNVVYSEEAGKK